MLAFAKTQSTLMHRDGRTNMVELILAERGLEVHYFLALLYTSSGLLQSL